MDNLFVVVAVGIAFLVTSVSGIWLLPMLRKLNFGQTILDIGPKWHKNKQGTPTMGGIMFIAGIAFAVVAGYTMLAYGTPEGGVTAFLGNEIYRARLFYGLILAIGFGLIGFADDYIKVVKKQNEGLKPMQKIVLQTLIGCVYLSLLYISGDKMTTLIIPFLGTIDIGLFYYPYAIFVMIATSNAVNLTDGIDGLLSSVTFVVGIAFMVITGMLYMNEMAIMAGALAGGCLGFLVWNFYPAKVFMGDTGSLFLGGVVLALAFGTGLSFFILLVGIIYVIEAGSVALQMTYFKITKGKRIFKMSPIHHHYEMSGWSEVKIVVIFSIITAIACAIAIYAVTKI